MNINTKINFNLFKPREEKIVPSAPPQHSGFLRIKWNRLIAWENDIIVILII